MGAPPRKMMRGFTRRFSITPPQRHGSQKIWPIGSVISLPPWVLFHAEHAVGIAGFRRAAEGEALELRFDFLPEAAGQGLASEFVQAALDHATLVPGQDRFFAIVGDDNPASIRVLEKAGFHAAPDGQRMQLDLRPRAGARRSDPTA